MLLPLIGPLFLLPESQTLIPDMVTSPSPSQGPSCGFQPGSQLGSSRHPDTAPSRPGGRVERGGGAFLRPSAGGRCERWVISAAGGVFADICRRPPAAACAMFCSAPADMGRVARCPPGLGWAGLRVELMLPLTQHWMINIPTAEGMIEEVCQYISLRRGR